MTNSEKTSPFKNRSRATIVTDILNYCKTPTLQTHIMYKANLSYSTLKSYIDMLVGAGLLSMETDPNTSLRMFLTTQKGLQYLEQTKILNSMLGDTEEPE